MEILSKPVCQFTKMSTLRWKCNCHCIFIILLPTWLLVTSKVRFITNARDEATVSGQASCLGWCQLASQDDKPRCPMFQKVFFLKSKVWHVRSSSNVTYEVERKFELLRLTTWEKICREFRIEFKKEETIMENWCLSQKFNCYNKIFLPTG